MSFDLVRRDFGTYVRSPLFMPKWYGTSTLIMRSYSASTVDASAGAFWTGGVASINRIPGSVYVNPSWNTSWATIASVTGSGLVSDIIPPGNVGGGSINQPEVRITVDGVLYPTISFDLTTTGQRGWLGWGLPIDAYHSGNPYVFQHDGAATAQFAAQVNSTSKYQVVGPQDPRIPGLLYFASSLLVEARMATNTGGGGMQDYAGVVMRRMS